ncbi:unnamed protein product [Rangifer tarandus platyrhynchus]|uniref:Uncharacterized protein n=2 Tax=Rangifer tarandus platyrhynchus TaxID=3082113 RepID=A0ABN8Y2K5_RANTA|nr:unnamed protein product [Rangifer tarandus platyrhynchus]
MTSHQPCCWVSTAHSGYPASQGSLQPGAHWDWNHVSFKEPCYGLNCINHPLPPPIHMMKHSPQDDCIWRSGFKKHEQAKTSPCSLQLLRGGRTGFEKMTSNGSASLGKW